MKSNPICQNWNNCQSGVGLQRTVHKRIKYIQTALLFQVLAYSSRCEVHTLVKWKCLGVRKQKFRIRIPPLTSKIATLCKGSTQNVSYL